MKKLTAVLTAAACLLTLTACGTTQNAPESTAETTAETTAAETTANDALCRKLEDEVRDSLGYEPVCEYKADHQTYQISFSKESLLTIYDKALQYDEVRAVWESIMGTEQQVSYELLQSTVLPEQPDGHVILRVLNPSNPDNVLFAAEDGLVIYDGVEDKCTAALASDLEVSLPSGDPVTVNLSELHEKQYAYVFVSVSAPAEQEDAAGHLVNVVDLIANQGFDQYDEICYAAVAAIITPYPSKVLQFTLDRETIDKVKSGELTADTLGEQLTDLWALPVSDPARYQ